MLWAIKGTLDNGWLSASLVAVEVLGLILRTLPHISSCYRAGTQKVMLILSFSAIPFYLKRWVGKLIITHETKFHVDIIKFFGYHGCLLTEMIYKNYLFSYVNSQKIINSIYNTTWLACIYLWVQLLVMRIIRINISSLKWKNGISCLCMDLEGNRRESLLAILETFYW